MGERYNPGNQYHLSTFMETALGFGLVYQMSNMHSDPGSTSQKSQLKHLTTAKLGI